MKIDFRRRKVLMAILIQEITVSLLAMSIESKKPTQQQHPQHLQRQHVLQFRMERTTSEALLVVM